MYKNSRSHSYCLHTYPQIRNKNVCFVSERHMKKNACWLYFGPFPISHFETSGSFMLKNSFYCVRFKKQSVLLNETSLFAQAAKPFSAFQIYFTCMIEDGSESYPIPDSINVLTLVYNTITHF